MRDGLRERERGVKRGRKWLNEVCEMGWDIYDGDVRASEM